VSPRHGLGTGVHSCGPSVAAVARVCEARLCSPQETLERGGWPGARMAGCGFFAAIGTVAAGDLAGAD
jgi:hypothetical protein